MSDELPEWIEGPEIAAVIVGDADDSRYAIGINGVTKIERTFKSGMHSHLPYVRIWKGDKPTAEFCQHGLQGVFFQD